MAEQLDKTVLTRLAWLTELRRQGHRQCHGDLFQGHRVCALGLLAEVAGLANPARQHRADGYYNEIASSAGLSVDQLVCVFRLNDKGSTFSEIADVVGGWGK